MSTSLIARLAACSSVGVALAGMLVGLASPAAAAAPDGSLAPAPGAVVSAQPYGPDTCKQGYVWREAQPSDHVCVTPETRQTTWDENALAASRREPNGGAYGPNTCKQGYVWREAFAADLVCVTPDRRAQAKADNAQAAARRATESVPDALRPGPHTVVLRVDTSLVRRRGKLYPPKCKPGNTSTPTGNFAVGWSQIEVDGDPCQAGVVETAVRFDEGPLNQVPYKNIDRAILTYGEAPAQGCSYPPGTGTTCWRSGSGAPEPKPDGCVAVLGFPTVDWINAAPPGLIPRKTDPDVKRTTPREWDVSVPYRWQYEQSAPLDVTPPPPFGFLLAGALTLDQLDAEDNTNCVSWLSNLELHITYTVPPDGGLFIPPH